MANPIAVTNTSPVIALVSIGHLHLLDELFDRIVVPPAVWAELIDKPGAPEPAQLLALRNIAFYPQQPIPPEAADLDVGERDAIALATSLAGSWVLLDEIKARRIAEQLGLPVKGTLGILVEAKRRGFVPALRQLLDSLVATGFHLAPDLIATVLSTAGE